MPGGDADVEFLDDNEGEQSSSTLEERVEETADDYARENSQLQEELTAFNAASDAATRKVIGQEEAQLQADKMDSFPHTPERAGDAIVAGPSGDNLARANTTTAAQADAIGQSDRQARLASRAPVISMATGLYSAVIASASFVVAILSYVKSQSRGTPEPTPGLPDATKQVLENQVRSWWALPDAQWWANIEQYCDRFKPSLQGQILMMDTTIQMSQALTPPWTWQAGDDKWNAVQAIANAYGDFVPGPGQSQSRALYVAVAAYEYNGFGAGAVVLPRQVAADIVQMALAQIIAASQASVSESAT